MTTLKIIPTKPSERVEEFLNQYREGMQGLCNRAEKTEDGVIEDTWVIARFGKNKITLVFEFKDIVVSQDANMEQRIEALKFTDMLNINIWTVYEFPPTERDVIEELDAFILEWS